MKHAKDTKNEKALEKRTAFNDVLSLVIFAGTFVVKGLFLLWLRLCRAGLFAIFVVNNLFPLWLGRKPRWVHSH